jgi:phasin family protein
VRANERASVARRSYQKEGEHFMANPQMPFMDINQLMEQFKIPGVDVSAIMESRRKDIEALVAANRQAYEGMQKLGQRQAEMLRDAMTEWQAMTMQMMSGQNLSGGAGMQAELGKRALDRALANMRELAVMATTSQTQAWNMISKRFQDSLEELRQLGQPK